MRLIHNTIPNNITVKEIPSRYIINIGILGFIIDRNYDAVEFYFLCKDNSNNNIIIKESFTLSDIDNDTVSRQLDDSMAYLHHPLHTNLDISKMDNTRKEYVKRVIESCNKDSSFYSDFVIKNIISSNDIVISADRPRFKETIVSERCNLSMPLNIYLQVAIINNSIINKYPIDIGIFTYPYLSNNINIENGTMELIDYSLNDNKYNILYRLDNNFFVLPFIDNESKGFKAFNDKFNSIKKIIYIGYQSLMMIKYKEDNLLWIWVHDKDNSYIYQVDNPELIINAPDYLSEE